jgi:exopolysaccharide biosynthesis polyprenyl glycosylphosphotransferase
VTTTVKTVRAKHSEPAPLAPTAAPGISHARGRSGLARRALLAADLTGLAIAYAAAQAAGPAQWPPAAELAAFAVLLPLWVVAAKLFGLYSADEQRIDHSTVDETVAVVLLATVAGWALFGAAHLAGRLPELSGTLLVFWLVAIPAVMTGRSAARAFFHRRPTYRQRALILGAGDTARLVARKLRQHAEYGVDVVGFVDEHMEGCDDGIVTIGTPAELPELVRRLGIERVIVAFGSQSQQDTLSTIRSLNQLDVYVDLVPRLFEIVGPSGRIHSIEGLPLTDLPPVRLSRSNRLVKRAIDIVGALVGLILTAPLFLVVPILIRRESPGPALFRQTRLGEQMRQFTVLKFRTMRVGADEECHREFIRATMDAGAAPQANGLYKLDRGDEVTHVGAFLRRTSLDELPQLLNVLRGDMSLVGPRPCIPYETQFFEPRHFERFLVPAGLTGLWQVTARAHSTFGEALDMDVAYARGWSIGLDLTLVLRTIRQVFTRKGTA